MVNEMTFPDSFEDEELLGSQAPPERTEGVNPVSERGEDEARDEFMRELEDQPSRPLTGDEKRAAEDDAERAPSVYAPASERVAKEPLPGDRERVGHMDPTTSERKGADALAERASTSASTAPAVEPPPGEQATTAPGSPL